RARPRRPSRTTARWSSELMERPSPERIYGLRELTRILSLTPKRVAQLRRLDLLRRDSGYTFRDLLALRAARALLAAGASVRQIQPPAEQAEVWFERASEWDADPVQWEDAIAAYRRVIAIDPTYAAAWNNLGLLLHRMGQYEDARKAYASALAQDPECAEAAYNLGSLDEDMG